MSRQSPSNVGVSKAEYGNWVAKRLVYVPAAVGAGFLVLSFWVPVLAILAVLSFVVSGYFAYARYLFAPSGGDVQGLVWSNLVGHIGWDGKGRALDIGCGSGAVTIRLAQAYPNATVTGIDQWGRQWEYSKVQCERNAATEGVEGRVSFQQGSASSLPFPDESFDVVVSNLTFHEVKDAPDKRLLIREALRVLKKGGKFGSQDLFLLKRTYGEIGPLLELVKDWGATRVEFTTTRDTPGVPGALKLPFMIGAMSLIAGEK